MNYITIEKNKTLTFCWIKYLGYCDGIENRVPRTHTALMCKDTCTHLHLIATRSSRIKDLQAFSNGVVVYEASLDDRDYSASNSR